MKIHIAHGRLTTRSATADRGRDAAVFSLSSGALGIRGELEEDSFQSGAAILSGFFDRESIVYGENAYGYPQYNEFSVYAPNALGFRLFWEGEEIRPGGGSVTGFEQTLDTGDGTVSHRYTALGPGGARLRVSFQRCVPLDCPGLLVIRCRAQPCGESGGLNIRAYLSPGGGAEQTSSDPRKCSAAQGVDTQFRAEGERLVCVKTLTRSGNTAAAAAQCAGNGRFEGVGRDERIGLEAEGGELGTPVRYSILQLIMAAPGWGRPFRHSALCPWAMMTSATRWARFRHCPFSGASTITRTSGSVPDSRTRMRPVSPSSSATAATAAWTAGSSWAVFLSFTRTLMSTWG